MKEMPPEQVSDFLSSATVALLPFPSGASFRRGTLLAAAACGVPIVTLAGPDTPPEMLRLLEPATCHDGMVAQLAAFLSGKAALETGHHRSCALAAMVSWHSIADRYLDTLNRVRSGAALPADAAAPTPVQAPAS
jgi:glycosyltransferase involved in cell wall biosynthesis